MFHASLFVVMNQSLLKKKDGKPEKKMLMKNRVFSTA